MKKLKVLILILAMMILTTGVITGCGDKYKNLSGEPSKDNVVLYLGEDESNVDTVTLSLHGLDKGDSGELTCNISLPIAKIDIKTDNETKESEITFTGFSGGNATAQFIHKNSSKVVATIAVSVVKKVKAISQNTDNNAIVVSKAGTKVAINTNKVINFDPVDTTEKEVTYRLKQNVNGVTVSENGVLTFEELYTGNLELVATVKDTNISTDVTLKVLQSLNISNFNLSYSFTGEFTDLEDTNSITLVNNRTLYNTVDLKVETNYISDDDIKVEVKSNDLSLVSINDNDNNLFTIVTGDKKGSTKVTISAYIVGYKELTTFEFDLPIEIIKAPNLIKINDNTDKIQDYDIYDFYQNNLGQKLNIEILDKDATNVSYALVVENGIGNIEVVDKKGNSIEINQELSTDMISILENEIYVKAVKDFNVDNIVLKVVAVGAYGYDSKNNETITELNLSLRKGVTDIKFKEPNNLDLTDLTYYLPVNSTRTISFNINQNEYSGEFYISDTKNILNFESTIVSKGLTNISFDISAKEQGETELVVTAQNGVSGTIKVLSYFETEYFSISADSYLDNTDIGSTKYEVSGENAIYGIQSLKHISIVEGKSVNLYINKYDSNGMVSNGALISSLEYTSSDDAYATISYDGKIYARRVTPSTLNIECKVYYYTTQGISEKSYTFECEVFKPIKDITILSNDSAVSSLLMYYVSDANNNKVILSYYKDFMEKSLSYRLLPTTSSHLSNITWEFDGEAYYNIDNSNPTKPIISINSKEATNTIISTNIYLRISQFGKTFIKKLPVTIIKIEEISNFNDINYSLDGGNNKTLVPVNSTNYHDLGEMYVDYREITKQNKITLKYTIAPSSATFDDVILYYVDSDTSLVTKTLTINDDNTLSVERAGTGKLYLIPKTKFISSKLITNEILQSSYFIDIKVADGLTEETAYELSSVEDLLKMNYKESLDEFRYYKLMNDIDVSRVASWQAIGTNSQYGFRGQLISNDKNYTIKGINLTYLMTQSGEMYGFFSKITNKSIIKNVNFEIQNFSISVVSSSSAQNQNSYLGGIAGLNDGSTIQNCNVIIKNFNVVFNDATNNLTALIGGIIGENKGTIENCNIEGNLNIDLESTSNIIAIVGGVAGVNTGNIIANFTNIASTTNTEGINTRENTTNTEKTTKNTISGLFGSENIINSSINLNITNLKNNDSSFGGIAGTNNGTIKGQVVEFKAYFNGTNSDSNVGGIAGVNNSTVEDCLSVLTNKLNVVNGEKTYLSSISGNKNIGGVVGKNNAGNITKVVTIALDISDYYEDKSSTMSPLLKGTSYVGGIVGYMQAGSLNNAYIKNYFVRNVKNTNDSDSLLDIDLNTIEAGNNAGAITGNNVTTTTNCYASNVYVNDTKFDESKNNDLIVIEQPTYIQVTITENYEIKNKRNLGLLEYIDNATNGYKEKGDVVKVKTNTTTNAFVNAFTSSSIISYNYSKNSIKNSIKVNGTGSATLRFTSLLNNSLRQEVEFVVIDNVSQFGFTKDIYRSDEIKNNISIKSGHSQDIYLDLKTSVQSKDVDYLTLIDNKYQYTVDNLKLRVTVTDTTLFTINNQEWDSNKVTLSVTDRISLVAKENVSGNAVISVELLWLNGDSEKVLETNNYKVEVYYGITDIHISSTSATISQKDNLELEIIVDTDNNKVSKDDIDLTYTLTSNTSLNKDNSVSQFNEDYIYVETKYTKVENNENNKLYYTAKISVSDKYKNDVELNGTITFTAQYKASSNSQDNKKADTNTQNETVVETNSQKENQSKSIDFNLTVKKQKVENINLSYFANAETDSQGKFTINEVPTTIAYPGSRGVLKVNVYPKEAVIKQVEVTYATNSAYSIQLSQLLYNKKGQYQSIKPNAVNINNGIRFTETYAYYTDKGIDKVTYDGNLFVGVGISGQCPEGLNYTITVRATTNDGSIYHNSITLTTTTKPSISISPINIQNQSGINYVAKGVKYNFNVNYTKIVDNQNQLDTISFKIGDEVLIRSNNDNGVSYTDKNNSIVVTQNSITQTGQGSYTVNYDIVFSNIKKNAQDVVETYSLETSFSKTVNSIESVYKSESPIVFEVEEYVIRSIYVLDDDTEVSVFRIGLGQTKDIKLGFNVEYDSTDETIKGKVDELTNTYSSYNGIWYATKDAESQVIYQETKNEDGTNKVNENANTDNYFTFSYGKESGDSENNVFKIYAKNRNANGNMLLSGGFYIEYTKGVPQVVKDSEVTYNKYKEIENNPALKEKAILMSVDFELNIFDTSGPNNYVPISSVDELLNDNIVQEGGYYRLTDNIVVTEPWTPLTKQIAVLDGNNYSIYLTKGFSEDYMYELDSQGNFLLDEDNNKISKTSVNLGLFDSLQTNMAVYNLNVVLPYYIQTQDDLGAVHYNDFSVYSNLTTLNIGYVAGVNNGIIYNCDAYSNAKLVNANDTESQLKEYETKSQLVDNKYDNFTTKTSTQTMFNIGGLTAINDRTGYITNSRSHMIARLDRGIVGGLVATNNNVIASSYYESPNISDTSKTIVLSNNPTTEDNSAIAGLVAVNSGNIRTSYVKGYKLDSSKYKNGYIQSSIVTSGLVSTNSGKIENCYANIPVSGTAQTSGLVYSNSGTINNCVAMSTLASKHSDHTPLIGTKNAGKEIQNTGTITDSYYFDNDTSSDYSSNLMTVAGVSKVTKISQENFPTLTFGEKGIWKIIAKTNSNTTTQGTTTNNETKEITLIDANDLETGHQKQVNTKVEDGYVKYVWNNLESTTTTETKTEATTTESTTTTQIASYVIGSASDFNAIFKDSGLLNNSEFNWKTRIVRDIEFSKSEQPQTFNIDLNKAIIQGNGMNISNIYLPGDAIASSSSEIDNFGLFRKISDSTVKDLVMTTDKLYANNSKNVGVLAGTISGSDITNITLETNNTVIQGINFVGGLAGTIDSSYLSLINIQAKVNANYTNKSDKIENARLYTKDDTEYNYSYAGALAGRVLGTSNIINVNVYGDTIILGYYTGAVVGYMGNNSSLTYANVKASDSSYLQARFIAGGLVAYNKGYINKSQVTGANESYYKGSPIIVGGLVGFNEQISNNKNSGTIKNSFNTLAVGNNKVQITGGIVGVTIGGTIQNVIVDSKVIAQDRAGGVIGVVASGNIMNKVSKEKNTTDNKTIDDFGWFINYEFESGTNFNLSNCIVYNVNPNSKTNDDKSRITANHAKAFIVSVANDLNNINDLISNYYVEDKTINAVDYSNTSSIENIGSNNGSLDDDNTMGKYEDFNTIDKGNISLKFNLNSI